MQNSLNQGLRQGRVHMLDALPFADKKELSSLSIPWHAGFFCVMYVDTDWDYSYPQGIGNVENGLPG